MLSQIRSACKLVAAFAVSLVFAVAALTAFAQQQEQAASNVPQRFMDMVTWMAAGPMGSHLFVDNQGSAHLFDERACEQVIYRG